MSPVERLGQFLEISALTVPRSSDLRAPRSWVRPHSGRPDGRCRYCVHRALELADLLLRRAERSVIGVPHGIVASPSR